MPARSAQQDSFGTVITSLMRNRGFKSDEQLARRAMQIQENQPPRVNVQRRTINNWRNNKSTPRTTSDQQFKLVAAALNLSELEIEEIEEIIEASRLRELPASQGNESKLELKPFLIPIFLVLCLSSIILLASWSFWPRTPVTFQSEIPQSELTLSTSGFIFDHSDKAVIIEQQLNELNGWELYVARNEIFARHGRPFIKSSSVCLQNHFDQWAKSIANPRGWYIKKFEHPLLSMLEYKNVEIIKNHECNNRGGQFNCNGQLNNCN